MKINKKPFKLTNKELQVMRILWDSSEPLTATEIYEKSSSDLSIYTVQNAIKVLLPKEAIKIDSYTTVYKSNARRYKAAISESDYAYMQVKSVFGQNSNTKPTQLMETLVSEFNVNDISGIEEIEKMLAEKKAQLIKKHDKGE